MAKFTVLYLVVKPLAGGGYGYYWQPSPALARMGWKGLNLGPSARPDDPAKLDLARARNAEVDAWRGGGAKPRAIKRFTQRHTMAELILHYCASENFTGLRPNTQRTNRGRLATIETWATDPRAVGGEGNLQVAVITSDRVAALKRGLMKPDRQGIVHHHRAHGVLSMLRTLLNFAERKGMIPRGSNPAADFGLGQPPPRFQMWEPEDVDAFAVAAGAIGYPDLAFAVELALYIGQREDDMLRLVGLSLPPVGRPASRTSNWREVHGLPEGERRLLAGDDGRVASLCVLQAKTNRWVGPPVAGAMRARIEARIAENARRPVLTTHLLIDDRTGFPWKVRQFIRKFVEAKRWAVDPPAEARDRGVVPRPELAELQYRDLRRTCVVHLGELNMEVGIIASITGHQLETVNRILETYMPRTQRQASRGVVARILAQGRYLALGGSDLPVGIPMEQALERGGSVE